MATSVYKLTTCKPETAMTLVGFYLYARKHYSSVVSKQYAVHRLEAIRQSGDRLEFKTRYALPLPKISRRPNFSLRVWEVVAGPGDVQNRYCDPAAFDRLVRLHRPAVLTELRRYLSQTRRSLPDGFKPFLLTALDSPQTAAPLLVFADWLEEQGNPKAGIIRDLCELTEKRY